MRSGEGSTAAAAAAEEEKVKVAAPFRLAELGLRVCAVPLAVASVWEMATNKQVDETYGEVRFSDLSGFRYLVWINAITAAYSVASILLSSCKFITRFDWLIFLLDQASAYLLLTSASAAAEVVYLAREGDREVSWGEVCSYFGRFCGAATVSVALNAAALLCFMALSLISAFRVFTKFNPPSQSNSKQQLSQEQGKPSSDSGSILKCEKTELLFSFRKTVVLFGDVTAFTGTEESGFQTAAEEGLGLGVLVGAAADEVEEDEGDGGDDEGDVGAVPLGAERREEARAARLALHSCDGSFPHAPQSASAAGRAAGPAHTVGLT
uniref:CASP-like protein n=1 Tax=Oryza glumipatula TaxID=40148 RepID=A0A0D9YPE4_9ORYZ